MTCQAEKIKKKILRPFPGKFQRGKKAGENSIFLFSFISLVQAPCSLQPLSIGQAPYRGSTIQWVWGPNTSLIQSEP